MIISIWKKQNRTSFVPTTNYYRATYSFNEFLSIRELPAFAQPRVVTHANGMLNFAIINADSREEAIKTAKKLSREWNSRSFMSRY
jgi:hypothetical protein